MLHKLHKCTKENVALASTVSKLGKPRLSPSSLQITLGNCSVIFLGVETWGGAGILATVSKALKVSVNLYNEERKINTSLLLLLLTSANPAW